MEKYGRIAGLAGLFGVLIGLFIFLVHADQKVAWMASGGAGVAALLFYVIACRDEVLAAFGSRSARYGANMAVAIVVVAGIVAVVNYISVRHPLRWDVNAEGIYTLSDQTEKTLRGLKAPVNAVAFFIPEDNEYGRLRDTFESYAYVNKQFTYEFVDYQKKPEMVKTFNVTKTGPRIILRSEGREARVKGITEEDLTNGLVKVTREGGRKVFFVFGHGENAIDDKDEKGYSGIVETLKNEGFDVDKIVLATTPIPKEAVVVIVSGPQKAFLPPEVKELRDYLSRGGHLMLMIEPETNPQLGDILSDWGIELGNDLIVDPMSKLFGAGATIPVISQYGSHEITKGFNLMTFFPTARSLSSGAKAAEGVTPTNLASTGPTAWAETDFDELKGGAASFTDGKDKKGPVPVGIVATRKSQTGGESGSESRLVVFGDSDFPNNQFRSFSGNGDLFVNSVSWLARAEDNISIRPKKRAASRVFLSQTQANLLKYTTVGPFPPLGALPLGLFLAAFFIWRSRKNK
jgi:ABC-type uncharacterized transport system involved in gliding motility auxiliary subunit